MSSSIFGNLLGNTLANMSMNTPSQDQAQWQATTSNTYTHHLLPADRLQERFTVDAELRDTLAFIETYLKMHHPEIDKEWRKVKAVQDRLKS